MTQLFVFVCVCVCVCVCRGVCLRPMSVFPEGRESGSIQSYHWTLYHQIHRKQVRTESTLIQYYVHVQCTCTYVLFSFSTHCVFPLSILSRIVCASPLIVFPCVSFSAFLYIFISPLLSFRIYLSFLLIVFLLSSCLRCISLLTLSAHAQRGLQQLSCVCVCVCVCLSVIHIFPLIIFYLTSCHSFFLSLHLFSSFHLSPLNPSSLILFVSLLSSFVSFIICVSLSLSVSGRSLLSTFARPSMPPRLSPMPRGSCCSGKLQRLTAGISTMVALR